MQIAVRGKNMHVTRALKSYVERKVGKLEKYFDSAVSAQVTLSVEKDRHIVEVTLPLNGIILRGEQETGDMYGSVDLVVDKLEKQIEKYKTRILRRVRANDNRQPLLTGGVNRPEEDDDSRIVRVKRFAMKPMPVGEAILQMNLVGHDFFVFRNAETEDVNVVYRRKDGNYGLIEPDV